MQGVDNSKERLIMDYTDGRSSKNCIDYLRNINRFLVNHFKALEASIILKANKNRPSQTLTSEQTKDIDLFPSFKKSCEIDQKWLSQVFKTGRPSIQPHTINMSEGSEDDIQILYPIKIERKVFGIQQILFKKGTFSSETISALKTLVTLSAPYVLSLFKQEDNSGFENAELKSLIYLMVRNSKSAILLEDKFGKILLVNKAFCDAIGTKMSPEQLKGLHTTDMAKSFNHIFNASAKFSRNVNATKEVGEAVTGEEITIKDGSVFSRDYIPLKKNGEIVAHFWQYNNITERVQACEKAEELLKAEQKYNKLNKIVLSVASHELKNPLSNILMNADMLSNISLNSEVSKIKKKVERIKRAASSMERILNDAMTLGELDHKDLIKSDLDSLTVKDLMETISKIQQLLMPNRIIKTNFSKLEIPDSFKTDKSKLNLILHNLISNAHKYSSIESPIYITGGMEDEKLSIFVQDKGIGIESDELDKVFDTFWRGSNVDGKKGSGLGLAIVKRASELINADVTINSNMGEGTIVEIILPTL